MFVWVNKWRPRCIAPKRRGDLSLDKKSATALECPRMAGGAETECPISPGKPSLPRETLQIPIVKIRTMRPSTCKPAKGIFSSYIWFWSCNHLLSRQFLISYSKLRETSGRFSQTVCFVQTWKTAEKISPLLMIMQLDQPPPNICLSIDDNLIGRYLLLLCVGRCHNPKSFLSKTGFWFWFSLLAAATMSSQWTPVSINFIHWFLGQLNMICPHSFKLLKLFGLKRNSKKWESWKLSIIQPNIDKFGWNRDFCKCPSLPIAETEKWNISIFTISLNIKADCLLICHDHAWLPLWLWCWATYSCHWDNVIDGHNRTPPCLTTMRLQ